jgi:guanylate kinase
LRYSVSYTTRRPRSGEQDRVAYHFISREEFVKGIQTGRWAEWAEVHGHYYGTSAEFINRELASGHDILLDIDVQGAMQIRKRFADSVMIFIMPPSRKELAERLRRRGSDSREEIERRLKNAEAEMASRNLYRHILVNDRLDIAVEELVALIASYRSGTANRRR